MEKVKQLVKKYWENITWPEVVLILGLACILMFGLLYKLGTLSSGYHFLDDHELIRMEVALEQGQSLGSVIGGHVENDLNSRFRPFYWVERCAGAAIFGSNMLYWNYYTAIKGILTFCLLYFTARYLKCNPLVSGLFTGVILYGAQFTPWYRSANQENTGLLLCALTMCLIAAQAHYRKYKNVLLNVAIVAIAILCGLMKESFTLMLPAFGLLKLWLEYKEENERKLMLCLKQNWWVYAFLAAAFAADIFTLLFGVGVDNVTYAGFHESSGLSEYWLGILTSYRLYLPNYVNMAAIFLVLILICLRKKSWKNTWGYWLLGGYILASQLVAHAKSGMWERYIIPWIVGYALVFVVAAYGMLKQTKIVKWIYLAVFCVLLVQEMPTALAKGRDYAYDGKMVGNFFQTVLDNTEEEDLIICTFYDEELNLSSESWLEKRGRTQVCSGQMETGEFVNHVQFAGVLQEKVSWQQAKVIACYDSQVEAVLAMLEDSENYFVNVNGHYAVIGKEKGNQ